MYFLDTEYSYSSIKVLMLQLKSYLQKIFQIPVNLTLITIWMLDLTVCFTFNLLFCSMKMSMPQWDHCVRHNLNYKIRKTLPRIRVWLEHKPTGWKSWFVRHVNGPVCRPYQDMIEVFKSTDVNLNVKLSFLLHGHQSITASLQSIKLKIFTV